jgi:uncharacterized repeat protein (TIGR03803 family)
MRMACSLHERLLRLALSMTLIGGIGHAGIAASPDAFAAPDALLLQAGDGTLYLVLPDGGSAHLGAVLRSSAGVIQPVYEFHGDDGALPNSTLVQADDGSFVGTTEDGGARGLGTVYQLAGDGRLLHSYAFSGGDGAHPDSGLEAGPDGLYGSTREGGAHGAGTLFRYDAVHGTLQVLKSLSPDDTATLPDEIFRSGFDPAPTITSLNAASFTVGTSNTFTVTTTNRPTIQYSGTLPGGVSFVDHLDGTGTLSGTPAANTQAGSPYALTLTASNGTPPNAVQGFTLTLSCPTITVNDATVTLIYNDLSSGTFMQTGGHGTIAWSASGLPPGTSIDAATGAITGKPTQTGTFSASITATDAFGCAGTRNNKSLSVQPFLLHDVYNAVGNTQLVAAGHSTPTTPYTTSSASLIANDQADVAIAVTAGTFASTNGSVTMDAAGKFTYTPNVGFTGLDNFSYTATANGVSATGHATVTVADVVWYVNNSYAGANGASDGRSHRPFTDMTTASGAALANQNIYVHTGAGTTGGTTTLKTGQQLIGNGAEFMLDALDLPAGTPPTLGGVVTLNASDTVKGFNLNATLTDGGNDITNVAVNIGAVSPGSAPGLVLTSGGSGSIALASLTCAGAPYAIDAVNFAGSISIGSLTSTSTPGIAVILDNVTSATLSGTVDTTPYGTTALQLNSTALTVGASAPLTLTSALSVPPGAFTGSDTIQVTGGTVSIDGGTNGIQSSNSAGGAALVATSGGTLTVTGGPNTLQTGAGAYTSAWLALYMQNTTIGAAGVTFRSISANGALNGINVGNAGTGPLTVTGNGGACAKDSDPCTGGAIVSGSGSAVIVSNVGKISLANMKIENAPGDGIGGTAVAGLDLTNMFLSGDGTAGGYYGIHLANLSGSSAWTNLIVTNSTHDNVFIDQTSGTLTSLAISNSTFSNAGASSNGIFLQPRGTSVVSSFTVSGSTFSGNALNGILLEPANSSAVSAFTVSTSTFTNNAQTGVWVLANDSSSVSGAIVQTSTFTNNGVHVEFSKSATASLQYKILNNAMTGAVSHAINSEAATAVTTGGLIQGRIEGNTIGGTKAVGNNGSQSGDGIRVVLQGQTQGYVLINNNHIYQTPQAHGIDVSARAGNPSPSGLDVTITNNVVDTGVNTGDPTAVSNALSAISVIADCAGTCNTTRANIGGNTVPAWSPGSDYAVGQLILVQAAAGAVCNLVGSGASAVAVLQAANTGLMATFGTIALIAGPINTPP